LETMLFHELPYYRLFLIYGKRLMKNKARFFSPTRSMKAKGKIIMIFVIIRIHFQGLAKRGYGFLIIPGFMVVVTPVIEDATQIIMV